jgi:hypothetical protein
MLFCISANYTPKATREHCVRFHPAADGSVKTRDGGSVPSIIRSPC